MRVLFWLLWLVKRGRGGQLEAEFIRVAVIKGRDNEVNCPWT